MEKPSLHPDQHDVLQLFVAAEVRYLVIGGYAFSAHAFMRGTKDIDIWIDPDRDNAARVWQTLKVFGAPLESHGVKAADFYTPGTIYQIGVPPVRIDFLTTVADLDFAQCWARKIVVEMESMPVNYIGLDDLIAAKTAAGRKQDLLDLEALYRVKRRQEEHRDR